MPSGIFRSKRRSLFALCAGDVQGCRWICGLTDGARGVLGVSFGDQLVSGKHGCRGLQLHCRTHGRVGRRGVRGVRGGDVQDEPRDWGVLCVSPGDELGGREWRVDGLHLHCGVHGGVGRGRMHGVWCGDVQGEHGDRQLRCLSGGDELWGGDRPRRGDRLHLFGGVHGGLGRSGVRGVRGGHVQVSHRGRHVRRVRSRLVLAIDRRRFSRHMPRVSRFELLSCSKRFRLGVYLRPRDLRGCWRAVPRVSGGLVLPRRIFPLRLSSARPTITFGIFLLLRLPSGGGLDIEFHQKLRGLFPLCFFFMTIISI